MITILSFYNFKKITKLIILKNLLLKKINHLSIKGLIILSPEGINGTLAGTPKNINILKKTILRNLKLIKFDIENITKSTFIPFLKAKIKIKSEVVPINEKYYFANKIKKKYLSPFQWNKFLAKKNIKVIDARKPFEYEIGTFKGSINPDTYNFREFKKYLSNIKQNDHVGMFCTGGIRCEKASAYLRLAGYKNIFQLNGGIIKYLEYIHDNETKKSLWNGECFVFDNRVSINKELKKGDYLQCYGCRNPITKKDTKSKKYKKGVSCHKCYDIRTKDQKGRSLNRQIQIDKGHIIF